jgi:hypothetical protein
MTIEGVGRAKALRISLKEIVGDCAQTLKREIDSTDDAGLIEIIDRVSKLSELLTPTRTRVI